MPHLDVIVAALWPKEELSSFIADVKRMTKLPHSIYHLNTGTGDVPPKTLSSAWNELARKGKGDLLAFMKTDVLLSPGWDLRLSETLEAFPQVGVAIPAFFGNERPIKLVAEGPPTTMKEGEPGISDMTAIAAWAEMFTGVIYLYEELNAPFSVSMTQRSTWESLDGFDERFRIFGHDHDFQTRMNFDTGQLAASARSCPVYSKTGMTSMESLMRTYADLGDEHAHLAATRELIAKEGPWHKLSKEAKEKVRANPKFSGLPLSRYGAKLMERRKGGADVE